MLIFINIFINNIITVFTKAISIFTGDTTNNIYVKKSRIKDDILKLDASIAERILDAINSK